MVITVASEPKPLRRNKLRRYAQDTVELRRVLQRIQEELIIETEARLYQRYRAHVRHEEPRPSYEDWLLTCYRLENTFSAARFGVDTRLSWASRVVKEAMKYTLGHNASMAWFIGGLEVQIAARGAYVRLHSIWVAVDTRTLTFDPR
ncbi:hypothetical protein GW746_00055 [Candidatus Saccharibacteria bacterium]|nr:hypothetical protein [Candidatus Saccharibacteria bacterium]NCS82797.1 hypothetical protein [Candidatus Saccharibacteria bacterium]